MGYTNSVGKPFTSESIARVLKNEKAKGIIILGKYHHDFNLKKIVKMPEEEIVRVEDPELAYVSTERFDRVQARLRSKTSNGRGKHNGSDPLSGKIYCGKCGAVLWRRESSQKNKAGEKKTYYHWTCSSKFAKGNIVCEGTSTTTVKIRKVYKEIAEGLDVNKSAVKASMVEWLENLKRELSKEDISKNASRELQNAQKKKEKLLEVYLEGLLDKEAYKAKYKVLEAIIKEQEKLLAPLEENKDIKEIEETLKNIDSEIDAYISDPSFNDNKIDFLIEHTKKIVVNGKHLIIEMDLLAGAIIAGKNFLLFVHDKVQKPNGRVCYEVQGQKTWH